VVNVRAGMEVASHALFSPRGMRGASKFMGRYGAGIGATYGFLTGDDMGDRASRAALYGGIGYLGGQGLRGMRRSDVMGRFAEHRARMATPGKRVMQEIMSPGAALRPRGLSAPVNRISHGAGMRAGSRAPGMPMQVLEKVYRSPGPPSSYINMPGYGARAIDEATWKNLRVYAGGGETMGLFGMETIGGSRRVLAKGKGNVINAVSMHDWPSMR